MKESSAPLRKLATATMLVAASLLPLTSSSAAGGEKAPATDNTTRADAERMLGTWRLVRHEPEQRQATRTRAEYIAKGLLLQGTAKVVLIKNLCSVPVPEEVVISRNLIKAGRTEYRYSPGRGKLVVHRRGDKLEKQFRSVYDKIGATAITYRFEKDGTLILETNSLKELGGKTIRYTLSRSPEAVAGNGLRPGSHRRANNVPDGDRPMRNEPSFDAPVNKGIRTWTSIQGSKLEAELLAIANSNVVLKIKDGNVRTVLIRALSEEDQIYIRSIAHE